MVGFPDSMAEAVEVAVWALALEAELEALRPMGFKEAYLQENEIKALESRCAAQEEALRQCRTSVAGYAITSDRQLQGVVDSFLKESLGGFQAKARVAAWW